MTPLRLGVIGLSEGNGHPYSWSAICNGYDPAAMEDCGFPVIPRYLEKQRWPDDMLTGARVTHVWAQEFELGMRIARAALIPHVAERFTDMLGEIDALLLARDDAETHYEFAAPFLQAGIPVYVDKPLALTTADARKLLAQQQYPGQLFSCSALRYARELMLSAEDRAEIGALRCIHAVVPKDWNRYAVHAIDPMLGIATGRGELRASQRWQHGDSTVVQLLYSSGLQLQVSALGGAAAPVSLRVIGSRGWKDLFFRDTYSAFKSALCEFVRSAATREVRIEEASMLDVVEVIEAGVA